MTGRTGLQEQDITTVTQHARLRSSHEPLDRLRGARHVLGVEEETNDKPVLIAGSSPPTQGTDLKGNYNTAAC